MGNLGGWRLIPWAIRLARDVFELGTLLTIRTRHDFSISVDVGEWLGRHLYVTGEYEPATTRLVKRILQPGDVFVDVGGNVGYFSLLAARCIGNTGAIITFEPIPALASSVRANARLNGFANVTVHELALSDNTGRASFWVGPSDHMGISSLRSLPSASMEISVPVEPFDSVYRDDKPVRLVKIDTEGAEYKVLRGMTHTLKEDRPDIILEVSPQYLKEMDSSVRHLDSILGSLDYRTYAIEHDKLRPIDSLAKYESRQFNAFLSVRRPINLSL